MLHIIQKHNGFYILTIPCYAILYNKDNAFDVLINILDVQSIYYIFCFIAY